MPGWWRLRCLPAAKRAATVLGEHCFHKPEAAIACGQAPLQPLRCKASLGDGHVAVNAHGDR
eukprot:364146-Chlamydomonas_euryale.AAC.4